MYDDDACGGACTSVGAGARMETGCCGGGGAEVLKPWFPCTACNAANSVMPFATLSLQRSQSCPLCPTKGGCCENCCCSQTCTCGVALLLLLGRKDEGARPDESWVARRKEERGRAREYPTTSYREGDAYAYCCNDPQDSAICRSGRG